MDTVTLDQILVEGRLTHKNGKQTRRTLAGQTLGNVSIQELLACTAGSDEGEGPLSPGDDPYIYAGTTAPPGTPTFGPRGLAIHEIVLPEEDE